MSWEDLVRQAAPGDHRGARLVALERLDVASRCAWCGAPGTTCRDLDPACEPCRDSRSRRRELGDCHEARKLAGVVDSLGDDAGPAELRLAAAITTSEPRAVQLEVLALYLEGVAQAEIARRLGMHERQVTRWISRLRAAGLRAFLDFEPCIRVYLRPETGRISA